MTLMSLDGVAAECALHFEFFTSNNEAEYEALVIRSRMAKELGIQHLRVHSDSQLIIGQVQGEYKVQELNMIKYVQNIKDLTLNFITMNIQQILRIENVQPISS